jgi:phosphomannomutase / phosphoglucomutase
MFDRRLFREYDIRGRAPEALSPALAERVAAALGTRIRRRGGIDAVVGRDVRTSSPTLADAVRRGLASTGLTVHDLGVVPTPVVYYATHRLGAGGAAMVTGSHNPPGENGLKMCLGPDALYGDAVRTLCDEAEAGAFVRGAGRIESRERWLAAYVSELAARFEFRRPVRVAVDCGNGVMGPVALDAFARVGVEVDPLYCDQDGTFPNHIPDPEVPKYMETLRRRVLDLGLDAGLGFDGDGDRVGVIDERGRKISADRLIAVFARDILRDFPGGVVRYDVKCGDFLESVVRAAGGRPVMGKTGHSLLKRDVKEADAVFGGELSGHVVWNRGYLPIDDALFAALQLLRLRDLTAEPLSALFADLPETVSTAEIKVPCDDDRKFRVTSALVARFKKTHEVVDLDGARVRLCDGWFLVRASNTTPNLTVRFEASRREELISARDLLASALRDVDVDPRPLFEELE